MFECAKNMKRLQDHANIAANLVYYTCITMSGLSTDNESSSLSLTTSSDEEAFQTPQKRRYRRSLFNRNRRKNARFEKTDFAAVGNKSNNHTQPTKYNTTVDGEIFRLLVVLYLYLHNEFLGVDTLNDALK